MNNAPILKFLQNKVSLNKEPDLFFAFASKIFDIEFQKIFFSLMKNDVPTKETMNCLDKEGFTPFLKYIDSFTQQYPTLLQTVQNKIN